MTYEDYCKMEYKNITFDKKHLRNCLRTLKRYFLIEITEIYNNKKAKPNQRQKNAGKHSNNIILVIMKKQ